MMNENKEGEKYRYPNFFVLVIGYIRVYFHLPYRQTEGIIKATGKNIPNHLSYGQICRRLSRLDIDSSSIRIEDDDADDYGDIVIAIDSKFLSVLDKVNPKSLLISLYNSSMNQIRYPTYIPAKS